MAAKTSLANHVKGQLSTVFPFTYKKPAAIKMLRKIVHRLLRKKGEYKEVSVGDRLAELFDPSNQKWHKHLALLLKKGIKYDRNLRIQFTMVKIKDIYIDDDIQRNMDPDHVVKIGNINNFHVSFMSAIQGTKDVGKWKFHSTNAQHTVVYEAALAYHGLWDGYDGDWSELEVPFLYIETNLSKVCADVSVPTLKSDNDGTKVCAISLDKSEKKSTIAF